MPSSGAPRSPVTRSIPRSQVPIIAPIRHKKVEVLEREALKTKYSNEFLIGMMDNPDLIRNIAVVGHLHHGKTLVRNTVPSRNTLSLRKTLRRNVA